MIRTATPVRFDDVTEWGRTKPIRAAVETNDGVEHEIYLKFSNRPQLGVEGLSNEVVAACLAADLSLPITEPLLVTLTPEWIASIPAVHAVAKEALRTSAATGFGSVAAGDGWGQWKREDKITQERAQTALEIFAFDAFISNVDRKFAHGKPNCLVKQDEFRIIDHEMAFRLKALLFVKVEPWKPLYLEGWADKDDHIFGAKLKGRPNLDFERIKSKWSSLTDARILSYKASLPQDWAGAAEAVDAALTHVVAVRDKIDLCLAELKRVLNV